MAAKDLAKKLMKATKAEDHNKELAKVLCDYLVANIQVAISYAGIIPGTPPVPDPIVADVLPMTGSISGLSNVDFNTWVQSVETGIMTGLQLSDPGLMKVKPMAPLVVFKKGLSTLLNQDVVYNIHTNPSGPMYRWEEISPTETNPEKTIEVNNSSELVTDKYLSDYAKIWVNGKDGEGYYKYYESIYSPCDSIWLAISEKIITWIELPIHITSFPAQGTSSGSKGTATILSIKVL